jgi:hypothetical protein
MDEDSRMRAVACLIAMILIIFFILLFLRIAVIG